MRPEALRAALARIGPTALLGVGLGVLLANLSFLGRPEHPYSYVGMDYDTYMAAGRSWVETGAFYHPYQLAGPYIVYAREILYPPITAPFLALFSYLPGVLWWGIPIGITAAVILAYRPSRLALGLVVWCIVLPTPYIALLNGNPVIWAMALLALGTRWPAFVPWVVLKPVFAPFALLHIRRGAWWAGAAVLAVASALLLPMWFDYVAVVRNAQFPDGPLYALGQAPLLAAPLIAWVARRRSAVPAMAGTDS